MTPFVTVDDSVGVKDALAELLDAAGVTVTERADAALHAAVPESELVAAMRRATLGLRRVAVLDDGAAIKSSFAFVTSRLSPREREVLELVARGLTADGVAAELYLSVETVRTHTRNAIRKLGARNRLHAVVMALSAGVIAAPAD